jgi:hypothetical protein
MPRKAASQAASAEETSPANVAGDLTVLPAPTILDSLKVDTGISNPLLTYEDRTMPIDSTCTIAFYDNLACNIEDLGTKALANNVYGETFDSQQDGHNFNRRFFRTGGDGGPAKMTLFMEIAPMDAGTALGPLGSQSAVRFHGQVCLNLGWQSTYAEP